MDKNVLIISTSLREGSNSDALADEFARGAKEAKNHVEKITLTGKTIQFCRGCLACQKTQHCVIDDDARQIAVQMMKADVIVFATPVYYYSISGQLKTMLDRANPLYTADYAFRDIYLLASAAEDEEHTIKGATTAIQGWVDCFEKANLQGTVFAGGVNSVGEIKGHRVLAKAYEMGKAV